MAAPTATDLQLAASLGDAAAQVRLGYMYLTGQGVAKDEARAVKLYEAAANQGDTHAQVYLGDMYERGVVAQDKARAAQLYQDAADQGRADAQVLLAHMYKHGRGVVKDEARAARLFQAAADQDNADAQYELVDASDAHFHLAHMYKHGRGVVKDEARAVQLFEAAADQGSADAQYDLALMYKHGRGVAKDEALAVQLYQDAADQGHELAHYSLGVRYANGRGVAKDDARAVRHYRAAADAGHAAAQTNLGAMYANGRGVAKDEARAVRLYRQAAGQGHAVAQYNLGVMNAFGRGVAKNDARAVQFYRQAAGQGLAAAQLRLGIVYKEGGFGGVARDFTRATELFQRAAAQGNAEARQRLARLVPLVPRDGVAPSVATSAPSQVGDGLLHEIDDFADAHGRDETRDDRLFRLELRGGLALGSDLQGLHDGPLRQVRLRVAGLPSQLPRGPSQLPATSQGDEGTCMCHALVRVVRSQLQHKYGKTLDLDAAVEALIQATKTHRSNKGLDVDDAVAALSQVHLQSEGKQERYMLHVTAATYADFDQLVLAIRNSQGVHHIVTGTGVHAVVAGSVEETASGAAKVLCIDSMGGQTSRLGRFANRGAQPASQFYCFHVIDTVVAEVTAASGTKKKRLPGVLASWAGRFGTTADHLKQHLGLPPPSLSLSSPHPVPAAEPVPSGDKLVKRMRGEGGSS